MSDKLKCYLCNSQNLDRLTGKVRFDHEADVYSCRECSLTFLDQDSFEYPKDFYEKEYHQTYITHVEPDAFEPENYYRKMLIANRIWADKFKAELQGNERVLDVGCSTGHFLEMIKESAGSVHGYDLNRKEVSFCRDKLGLDVSDQPLEDRFSEGTFDYISLIYVLEHISDPAAFLEYLKPFLKPSGKLVILVPNIQDALVNLYDIPEFRQFYYCIEHLFYYNARTLETLFEKADLVGDIETIQEYPIANHLNWGFRRKPSDSVEARSGLPDIALRDEKMKAPWEQFWQEINRQYTRFLGANGFGDRLWAVVGNPQ